MTALVQVMARCQTRYCLNQWWHKSVMHIWVLLLCLIIWMVNGDIIICPKHNELMGKWDGAGVYFNLLWPSDAIWWHRSWSTLSQVMACCLTAPSHYLNQCWLIISEAFNCGIHPRASSLEMPETVLAITPSHQQNTHDFANGRNNMIGIFNDYVCSASHMRPGRHFQNV